MFARALVSRTSLQAVSTTRPLQPLAALSNSLNASGVPSSSEHGPNFTFSPFSSDSRDRPAPTSNVITLPPGTPLTLSSLSESASIPVEELRTVLEVLDEAPETDMSILDREVAEYLLLDYELTLAPSAGGRGGGGGGGKKKAAKKKGGSQAGSAGGIDPSSWPLRSPVVTVMGHVDHGKTTLLDTLRKAAVAASEAGGITQNISAFKVPLPKHYKPPSEVGSDSPGVITFLDTPGHAAFSAMRARGASVTDVVVLVVAADDGVMPQTKEAIQHAKDAEVPIVVAINKCDKPGADPTMVRSALLGEEVVLEEFGGDVQAVNVSALKGTGLQDLMIAVQAEADLADLRADPVGVGEGTVVESSVDKRDGIQLVALVQSGTLSVGDHVVAGSQWGRIKRLTGTDGKQTKQAGPSDPVRLLGMRGVASPGDKIVAVDSEATAKRIVSLRTRAQQEEASAKVAAALAAAQDSEDDGQKGKGRRRRRAMYSTSPRIRYEMRAAAAAAAAAEAAEAKAAAAEEGAKPSGPIIVPAVIKADVDGSLEALVESLEALPGRDEVQLKVIRAGLGPLTEGDIELADATEARCYTFNVDRPAAPVRTLIAANSTGPSPLIVRAHRVIYKLLEEVSEDLASFLPPKEQSIVQGSAVVQEVFPIKGKRRQHSHNVAGLRLSEGRLARTSNFRVLRDNEMIWEGAAAGLRVVKDNVDEVKGKGRECGIWLDGFDEVEAGDVIEAVEIRKVPRVLGESQK